MADPGLFGSLYNTVTTALDPTSAIKAIENGLFSSSYTVKNDVFPEDLTSEYMNHYVTFRFFDRGGSTSNYNLAVFVPSELGGGIFPTFSDAHEYADIHLTNIFMNQIGTTVKNFVQGGAAAAGRAINPGVQVLYKSTHLRTFEFAFLFAPRTEKESQSMESIIKQVRYNAAPLDEGYGVFKSPNEVEIQIRWMDKQNPHIMKMKRQVITNIDVNYAPSGTYSTFTNGYPVACMMALRTREMEIITKSAINEGY